MAPGVLQPLLAGDSEVEATLRTLIDGRSTGAIVYAVFNRCALYIGKALCMRSGEVSGPAARLLEHHRAFRLP